MAHKKGVGSTDNGRDSNPKFLGVKLFGGQAAKAGNIIIRQRGTKFHPGENVGLGRDYTIYSLVDGTVSFKKGKRNRTFVSVLPVGEEAVATVAPKKAAAPKKEAAPKKAAESKAAAAPKKSTSKSSGQDDLKKIEGIGPKIAEIMNGTGIMTFADLAAASVDTLKSALENAGNRYKMHDPTTWPQQASLAADGKWDELKQLQDDLDGGRPQEEE